MAGNHAALNNFLTWIGIEGKVSAATYGKGIAGTLCHAHLQDYSGATNGREGKRKDLVAQIKAL
jgi:hypothetical protein